MNVRFCEHLSCFLFAGILLSITSSVFAQVKQSNVSYVDPSIGGVGIILEPARPTVHLPNSMLRVYPIKKDQLDDRISSFPLNVASHRIAWVFSFLPVSGDETESLWDKNLIIEKEALTPYYYKVTDEEYADVVEFSPAERSGYFKTTFNSPKKHHLRLGLFGKTGEVNVEGKRIVSGTESFSGMKAYFYAECDADIITSHYQSPTEKQQLLLAFSNNNKTVGFKYGISYISIEQAKQNLYREIPSWNFSELKHKAFLVWDKKFMQINVKGGTLAQKRVFYTSLYRSYERMVDINEYGKYYSAYDHKIHESKEPFFVDNWIWDNYIALEPLHMILDPKKETEKIKSYIKMYEQGGWMPSFAVTFGDWPAMTGNHAASWIADAWFKGLRGFDVKKAYEGLKKNSLEGTLIPWKNGPATVLDSFYNKNGYMPGLAMGEKETVKEVEPTWEKRQAVSVTLENSYSDWCIAQLAIPSGNQGDKELFLKRAAYYKNVFRTEKGMMWPKDAEGKWIEPFNSKLAVREYFTENNAYTYNWHVKHDLQGVFQLMGGLKLAENKLDQLFREDLSLPKWKFWNIQPDASGLVGQFVMGNEPSFHIPYLYNYLGAPWKTQKRIRMLLDTWFTDNLFGLPGDEDGGGMTSFVVFSMMGFFPVTPGIPVYNIGSPVFSEIDMSLPNGKSFKVIAKNYAVEHIYIQRALLNGKELTKPWFTHADLVHGGTLELFMGSEPNKRWGALETDIPPSNINLNTSLYN
ncbi:GH92 family glycosyl hydrolase [Pedobacter sp. B4-66]|uniref:GH92 family glycosyl hydrolase n=1 Tax=Pedobacter sp. B4-66 TaxID=2817280 RepID=UPI001BDA6C6B|nr:GH92 family glycosyl hydrolase [Pedobacter sp. B4-66]